MPSKRPGLFKILMIFLICGGLTVGLGFINIWLGVIAILILTPLSADLMRGQ